MFGLAHIIKYIYTARELCTNVSKDKTFRAGVTTNPPGITTPIHVGCSQVNQGWARETVEESKETIEESDGNAPEVAWSLEAHVNLGAGVGVRRRLSPRSEGCSLQGGAGAGGGSGDRGGWAPVSPPKQDGLQLDTFEEMDDRLRPRMVAFTDEATEQSQIIFDEPPPEDGGRCIADASPMSFAQVLADASTPKAGAEGLGGNGFGRDPTATPNHSGLKCNSTLYDRETNMLGGPRVSSYRGRKGRGRSPRPSASPKGKSIKTRLKR